MRENYGWIYQKITIYEEISNFTSFETKLK